MRNNQERRKDESFIITQAEKRTRLYMGFAVPTLSLLPNGPTEVEGGKGEAGAGGGMSGEGGLAEGRSDDACADDINKGAARVRPELRFVSGKAGNFETGGAEVGPERVDEEEGARGREGGRPVGVPVMAPGSWSSSRKGL